MDSSHLPTDHFAKSTRFTKDLYYDVYPSVDPSTAPLSQQGKVVLITGASSGIGRHGIAMSFAKAGARVLILAGQNKQGLKPAAAEINAVGLAVQTDVRVININDAIGVKNAFIDLRETYDRIDILVNNAGSGDSPLPIIEVEAAEWWYNFEVMVKGTFFMTHRIKHDSLSVKLLALQTLLDPTPSLCLSRISNVRAVGLHPGILMIRMTPIAFQRFARDTFELVGGVTVWLATERAAFMNGRYMSVNWSVGELLERKKEIVSDVLLEIAVRGKSGHCQ
ncbi:oxidoreductase [Aspergillus insuetus]